MSNQVKPFLIFPHKGKMVNVFPDNFVIHGEFCFDVFLSKDTDLLKKYKKKMEEYNAKLAKR